MTPPRSARKILPGDSRKAEKAGGDAVTEKKTGPVEERRITIDNYTELPKGHPARLDMALHKVLSTGSLRKTLLEHGKNLVYESRDGKYIIREHPDGRKYRRLIKPGAKYELFHDPRNVCPSCGEKLPNADRKSK